MSSISFDITCSFIVHMFTFEPFSFELCYLLNSCWYYEIFIKAYGNFSVLFKSFIFHLTVVVTRLRYVLFHYLGEGKALDPRSPG